MKTPTSLMAIIFVAAFCITLPCPHAWAQTVTNSATVKDQSTKNETAVTRPQTPAVQANASFKKLGFRVANWKTTHSHSETHAQEEIATLKKIGCEVETEAHGNHVDVRYRCPEWRSIKLSTDQLINQWSTWCAAKGMETVIMNPPANTKLPTVKFRLTASRTVHLHNPKEAAQIVNTLKLVGCQVATNSHGDHMDATYSCPEWVTIELVNEKTAHSWQKWLNDSGFETQHTHVK
ncbi:MAG: hypothetical protein P8J27_11590 [Mariniblastus sp.]|nr:hypothetical protein [Mariniblastus sp.]